MAYSAHDPSVVNGVIPSELTKKLIGIWCLRSGRNPNRVKALPKRITAVQARINEGYTADDLCMAIAGVCYSPFHRDNGYNTIDVAIRNGVQVEKGIQLWFRYAPVKYIAEYVKRTGERVPEREDDLAAYRRDQRREAELKKQIERLEKQRQAEEETRLAEECLDEEYTKECGG